MPLLLTLGCAVLPPDTMPAPLQSIAPAEEPLLFNSTEGLLHVIVLGLFATAVGRSVSATTVVVAEAVQPFDPVTTKVYVPARLVVGLRVVALVSVALAGFIHA